MLELIAMAGGLIVCCLLPISAKRVRDGRVSKNFKGDAEAFRAANFKQLTVLMWVGIGIGGIDVTLALLNASMNERGEWEFNLVSAAIWLTAAVIAYRSRQAGGTAARVTASSPIPAIVASAGRSY